MPGRGPDFAGSADVLTVFAFWPPEAGSFDALFPSNRGWSLSVSFLQDFSLISSFRKAVKALWPAYGATGSFLHKSTGRISSANLNLDEFKRKKDLKTGDSQKISADGAFLKRNEFLAGRRRCRRGALRGTSGLGCDNLDALGVKRRFLQAALRPPPRWPVWALSDSKIAWEFQSP